MNFNERLQQVGEILVALSGTPASGQQLQILSDYAVMALDHDFLAVCLLAPDEAGYLVHTLSGIVGGAIPQRLFQTDEGVVGQVLHRNKPHCLPDITAHEAAVPDFEGVLGRFGLQAGLVVPLRQEQKVLGALLFAAEPPRQFDDDDVQIAGLLAAGLSAALETARLYQWASDERSMLSAVLASTEDAVLVVNEAGLVLMANPAVKQLLGLDPAQLTGQPLANNVTETALLDLFQKQQADVVELPLPDGRIAQASLTPVSTPYGESVGWAAVFRDITLLKELEQMKNEFVATVSHDLKNPISVIQLAANLLNQAGDLNESQLKLRQQVLDTAVYMDELVGDLLDLGKIEAGLDMKMAPFDFVKLVQEVTAVLQPSQQQKEQQLTTRLPDTLTLTGDRSRLKQVLLNLVGNAIKYTPAGGDVSIEVTETEQQVTVNVVDAGLGIPAQALPYVFDKFYRVDSEQTKQIKGTGLGLAIARSVVEAHNGRIWAESEPGQGSTFGFTLPRSQ